jgi:hypothetical protein
MGRRLVAVLVLGVALSAGAAEPAVKDDPATSPPQEPWSLDLTVHDVGVGIGNSKHIDGLRLNFRDVAPFTVHGINLTLWIPEHPERNTPVGDVTGLALGVPATGAGTLRGVGVGFGLAFEKELDGVGLGILGAGAGGSLRGISIGGLGLGAGDQIQGIALGGLGVGSGEGIDGLAVGGLGVGSGGDGRGILVGGLGAGVGGNLTGLVAGGLGVGVGGDLTGVAIGGLGVGAGGRVRGLAVAGLGVGCGDSIEGVAVAGLGVGSPRIRGLVAALAAGGQDVAGVAIAPAYFYIQEEGSFTGVSLSAFNRITGEQHGVAIGIVNYTPSLHGVQLGLVNIALNNRSGLKVLPIANAHFD